MKYLQTFYVQQLTLKHHIFLLVIDLLNRNYMFFLHVPDQPTGHI